MDHWRQRSKKWVAGSFLEVEATTHKKSLRAATASSKDSAPIGLAIGDKILEPRRWRCGRVANHVCVAVGQYYKVSFGQPGAPTYRIHLKAAVSLKNDVKAGEVAADNRKAPRCPKLGTAE